MTRDLNTHLTDFDWAVLVRHLRRDSRVLFHDKGIRTAIAKRRAEHFNRLETFQGDRRHQIDIAVDYNANHARNCLESHSQRIIYPLAMLDPCYEDAGLMRVLSLGPRTEAEIFKLIAAGFTAENIDAVDIVSNSPLIEIGDMHALAKPDNTYDVVIAGWLLPYSKNPRLALSEMCRVLKPGGVIAIGLTREPEDSAEHAQLIAQGSATYLASHEIIADFPAGVIVKPLFVHEPLDLTRKGAILVIVRIAKA